MNQALLRIGFERSWSRSWSRSKSESWSESWSVVCKSEQ